MYSSLEKDLTAFSFLYSNCRLIDPQTQVTRTSVSIISIYCHMKIVTITWKCWALVASLGNHKYWLVLALSNLFSQFELASVTQFAAHQDNKRLIGFVVCVCEDPGEDSTSAYVFESNTEGEKVWRQLCLFFVHKQRMLSLWPSTTNPSRNVGCW